MEQFHGTVIELVYNQTFFVEFCFELILKKLKEKRCNDSRVPLWVPCDTRHSVVVHGPRTRWRTVRLLLLYIPSSFVYVSLFIKL